MAKTIEMFWDGDEKLTLNITTCEVNILTVAQFIFCCA